MTNLNTSFAGFHHQTWAQAIAELEQAGTDYVIVTVLSTTGSTPRATGTKMIISGEHIYDTIGGGHLEFKVIEKARALLAQGEAAQHIEQFHLGANLGQCCGGAAVVMLEAMISAHLRIDVYGAGHVAQALMPILAQLPCRCRWIDSRAHVFPEQIPANIEKIVDEQPVEQIKHAAANSAFLILTHNHQLDFALTEAILKRDDASWVGVIGSDTKAKRFQHRLRHRQFSERHIEQMICPVGLENIAGKLPMEVAVSIAGQLINVYQTQQMKSPKQTGLQWQVLKQALVTTTAEQNEVEQEVNTK